MKNFEIIDGAGSSWLVAHAPHGEIVRSYDSLVDAKIALLEFEQEIQDEVKYWVVGDYVCEAGFGNQVGELPDFKIDGFPCLRMTQQQFDEICKTYCEEHGHYPIP